MWFQLVESRRETLAQAGNGPPHSITWRSGQGRFRLPGESHRSQRSWTRPLHELELDLLASDLRALAERQEAELSGMSDYGQKYLVRGILKGQSGRAAEVVTVWMILSGEDVPRFVTAFPGRR